jgi:hypothetical protein
VAKVLQLRVQKKLCAEFIRMKEKKANDTPRGLARVSDYVSDTSCHASYKI